MSGGGFSQARLARMRETMGGYVERGELPGLVAAVYRRLGAGLTACRFFDIPFDQ